MSDASKKDGDFETYLKGESPLSKQYVALSTQQPPADIDAKILAEAEQASKVVRLKRPMGRWIPALAVAATLMLCVSLVLNLSIQPTGPLTDANVGVAEYTEQASDTFSTGGERADSMLVAPADDIIALRRDRPESLPSAPGMAREELRLDEQALNDADFSAPAMAAENAVTVEPARPALPAGRVKEETKASAGIIESAGVAGNTMPAQAAESPVIAGAEIRRDGTVGSDSVSTPEADTGTFSMEPAVSPGDENLLQIPRNDEVLLRAVAMLREEFSAADLGAAPLRKQAVPKRQAAGSAFVNESEHQVDRLTEILSAYDADDPDTAWKLLMAFKSDYPDHPASARIKEMQQEE